MSYEAKRQKTARTLRKKGKLVTFTRSVKGEYDDTTASYNASLDIEQDVYALSLPASGGKIAALDERYKDGSLAGERYAYVMIPSVKADGADIEFEVTKGDKCELDNEIWSVLGSTPFRPNEGLAIYYDVALRI